MNTAAHDPRIRVLIADDHQLFAELVKAALARDNRLEVVGIAHDGQEALDLATELDPDVTLMDVFMPAMDGIEATRRLLAARPDARVIVFSGVSSPETFVRAREAGAVRCLSKEALAGDVVPTVLSVATPRARSSSARSSSPSST